MILGRQTRLVIVVGGAGHLVLRMAPRVVFEELYRSHAGAGLAFACRRTAPSDAEDVVAEVFLIAWRPLTMFRGMLCRGCWGWRVGCSRIGVAARTGAWRCGRASDRSRAPVAGIIATPDAESPALRALSSLSERDQEVLMLAAWDGLDRGQAAAVLGRPPSRSLNIWSRRHRGCSRCSKTTPRRCPEWTTGWSPVLPELALRRSATSSGSTAAQPHRPFARGRLIAMVTAHEQV